MFRALIVFMAAVAMPALAQTSPMERALAACGGTEIHLSAPAGTSDVDLEAAERVLNARLGGGFLKDYVDVADGGLVVRFPASTVDLAAFAGALQRIELGIHNVLMIGDAAQEGDDGIVVTDSDGVPYRIAVEPILTGADLAAAQATFDQNGKPALLFRFTPAAARLFGEFTSAHIGAPLGIVLDGEMLSAPVIRSPIVGGQVVVTGDFTVEEASRWAKLLGSGYLPIDLDIERADEVPQDFAADQSLCP